MTSIQILLTIDNRGKSVPYDPEKREDSENHGFKPLKGRLPEIENIPEAMGFPEIITILKSLNDSDSPFFSIGCEKCFNNSHGRHWAKGYIEFAFNYKELVSDAVQYFPLFFHFNRHAESFTESNDVQFMWELQAARLHDANVDGFTACVWITTGQCASAEAAKSLWLSAVSVLGQYLATFNKPNGGSEIYGET